MADAASNTSLGTVAGGSSANGINYAVNGSNLLSTNSAVDMNILSNYALDGNVTVSGQFLTNPTTTLTGSSAVTVTAHSAAMAGTFNRTGAFTITTTSGDIVFSSVGTSLSPATAPGVTLNAAGAVAMDNSYIATGGGNFSATGTGYTSLSDSNGRQTGVNLYDTTINAQGGSISLTGTGGYV